MFLERITTNNFRNLADQVLYFNRKINVIRGLNGQGKTNLLEAIYYLTVSRSFRTTIDSEIANFKGCTCFFKLKGALVRKSGKKAVEIKYQQPQPLQIAVNGVPIGRSEYIHRNPVVVFVPDDLLLIKEGPSFRRRFLNLEISRMDLLYYRVLKDYSRVLQQRNSILKESRTSSLRKGYSFLEPWNEALINLGSQIIRKRVDILGLIEKHAGIFYRELTSSEEKLSLQYNSSVVFDEEKSDNIEDHFEKRLKETADRELLRGSTLAGPHLDDFTVFIDGYDAKKYASQGQQRTAVLSIKMGEVALFGNSATDSPVVLLDDVFSEFDQDRRKLLLDFLLKREGQSFVTTASVRGKKANGEIKIISVDKGNIIDEQPGTDC